LPEQEKTASDIPTPQELSSRTIPEVNVPDSIERRVYQRKSQPASDPQINTSLSMQIRWHERHISDSSIARHHPLALGMDEASHLEPHQSLRAVCKSTPSLGQQKRIEEMTEEEMVELALQESALGGAPQQKRIEDMTEEEMMELAMKESAAIAPSSAYVGYQGPSSITTHGIRDTSSNNVNPSPSRSLPYLGEMTSSIDEKSLGKELDVGFQSTPLSRGLRTDYQSHARLGGDLHRGSRRASELAGPGDMTEEELLEMGIAASLKLS
jgi:hypothetical protein